LPRLRGACRAAARATPPAGPYSCAGTRAGSRPALRRPEAPTGAGKQPGLGGAGIRRAALADAEPTEQLEGDFIGDTEAGAERIASDRLPVLVLVLGGSPPRGGEERLVPAVLRLVFDFLHLDGRPGADGSSTAPSRPTMGRGRRAARRSNIETATSYYAAGGTAATIRPQAVDCAWSRFAWEPQACRGGAPSIYRNPVSEALFHFLTRNQVPEGQS
jgi:hypothetical protein